MKKRAILIAPGMSLFLIGTLMLLALTGFRLPPREAEVKVAAESAASELLPALVTFPGPERVAAVTAAAKSLSEVTGVAEVNSGTRWLNAWTTDAGDPPIAPAPGYQVPVDVASVDPEQFRDLVPAPFREKISQLAHGGAILSRTGAALRGITETGVLHFPVHSIPVIGVVDDNLVRNHEIVISHATGGLLALNDKRYLVIGLREVAAGKLVENTIRAAIPQEATMRVRGPAGSGASTNLSPLLSLSQIKATFGEFSAVTGAGTNIQIDQAWIDANTEITTIPLLGTFRCHKKLIPQIARALEEVEQLGLGGLIRPGEFGGCFSPRFIRSGKEAGLSRHAWGAAFDFNVSGNLYGQPPTMDLRLVEVMERHGFSWGGHWSYPDGMHFEFVQDGTQ